MRRSRHRPARSLYKKSPFYCRSTIECVWVGVGTRTPPKTWGRQLAVRKIRCRPSAARVQEYVLELLTWVMRCILTIHTNIRRSCWGICFLRLLCTRRRREGDRLRRHAAGGSRALSRARRRPFAGPITVWSPGFPRSRFVDRPWVEFLRFGPPRPIGPWVTDPSGAPGTFPQQRRSLCVVRSR